MRTNDLPLYLVLLTAVACSGDLSDGTNVAPTRPAARCPDAADPEVHYIAGSDQDPSICLTILFGCDEGQTSFSDECGCGCIGPEAPVCPDPADPEVHYVADSDQDPSVCQVILFGCEEGQTLFTDACGCGCIGPAAPVCPDPNDPEVHYVGGSDQDPTVCTRVLFSCEEGQEAFTNECGCGCLGPAAPVCPDPADPEVHYVADSDQDPSICTRILFACEEGQEAFSDECGCGCLGPAACPDPSDPAVHYVANSDQDPSVCQVILFGCEDDQELFTNACGCGCIDQP